MPSASDPIRTLWVQMAALMLVGLAGCAAAAVWAFRTVEFGEVSTDWTPKQEQVEPQNNEPAASGLVAALDTRLWTAPERAENGADSVNAEDTPPPPPPRLSLVGIISPDEPDSDAHSAILYDPSTDTTHIAQRGDQIGNLNVGHVTSDSAELITDSGPVTLRLDTGRQQADRG